MTTTTQDAQTARELVAEEARALMARRRVSQTDLAAATSTTQPYWSRRLTGAVALDVDDLAALAAFLDVPVTDLLAPLGARSANASYRAAAGHSGAVRADLALAA